MAKIGERVWGKGAACGNDSCLQLCVFSVGGEVRGRVWAKNNAMLGGTIVESVKSA